MHQTNLPLINNQFPSLSHQYFKYARNELTKGKMNPNIQQLFPQWPLNRMTQSQNTYSYPQLYERNGLIYEKIHSNNRISKFDLPRIIKTSYIPEAEIVHFPNENKYIPLSQINQYMPTTLENKPFKTKFQTVVTRKKQKQAIKRWKFIRSVVHMISLYKLLRNFSKCKINIKVNKLLHFQSFKENLIQIKNFILPSLHNLDDFCGEFFHKEIKYNTSDTVVKHSSIFIVKSFIHQLFTDLTSSFVFKEDIPKQIKYIFSLYIKENSLIPCDFLSTFEFNRLEFNHKLKLTHMNKERSAMMICMILLYRVILVDILDKYHSCFTQIQTMKTKTESVECKMKGNKAVNIERIINENSSKHMKKRYDDNYERDVDSGLDIYHYRRNSDTDDDDDDEESWNDLEKKLANNEDNNERRYIRYRNRIYKGEENNDHHHKNKHRNNKIFNNNEFDFYENDNNIEGRYIMTINHNKQNYNHPPPPPPRKQNPSDVEDSSNQSESFFEDENENKPTESKKSVSVMSSSTAKQSTILKPLTFLHQSFGKDDYARIKRELRRKMKKQEKEEKRLNEEARQKVLGLKNSQYKKKNVINFEQAELDVIIRRNFNFVINVLDYIFRTAINENVPIYRNEFKESFCYDVLVYHNKKDGFRKGNDDIEFLEGVIKNTDISEKFIKNNKRWLRMYVFNTFQFCSDFAQKIQI